MAKLVQFLSGNVPGGLLLLVFILLATNLAMFFLYRSSKLFSPKQYRRNIFKVNVPIFLIYIIYWIVLSPPSLPDSVLFMPFVENGQDDYLVQTILEENAVFQPEQEYRIHRWSAVLHAANSDSLPFQDYRWALVQRIGIDVVVSGELRQTNGQWEARCSIRSGSDVNTFIANGPGKVKLALIIMQKIKSYLPIFTKTNPELAAWDEATWLNYARARKFFNEKKYDQSNAALSDTGYVSKLLMARNHLEAGILLPAPKKKNQLEESEPNPEFRKVLKLLLPFVKSRKDDAQINFMLGRMYLFDEKYETAEILLAKSLLQYKYNPELYYNLHFLHWSRLHDMGFESRYEVLEEAIRLDPGYVSAVHDLADAYFNKGNKSVTGFGTTQALRVLDDFKKINPEEISTQSVRAKIYLETKQRLKALAIYQKLEKKLPQAAEIKYNIGICYFHLKKYSESKAYFEKVIAIKDFPDAYLYLGAIEQLAEHYDAALAMYRERIKRKSGDNDYYAKQAMRGIRNILSKQQAADSSRTIPKIN